MTPITVLGSRYGIQGALGRSVKRASSASTWWDLNGTITSCVAAYAPKGAASYAASKVNLTGDSTYDASAVGADFDWNATDGWIGDKSTTYLTTGIATPTVDGAELEWSMIVRFTGASPIPYDFSYECIIGSTTGYNRDFALLHRNDFLFRNGATAIWDGGAGGDPSSGIAAIAGVKGYFNGSHVATVASPDFTGSDILIGARYSGAYTFGGEIQAAAIYNSVLSDTQIGNLTTAMAAL